MEINLTVWRKRKIKYSKCDGFIYDVNVKRFGFIKPSSGIYDGEKLLLEQRWMVF